ncbi:MAG: IS256 family transposase [Phycisphaerales bacterium]
MNTKTGYRVVGRQDVLGGRGRVRGGRERVLGGTIDSRALAAALARDGQALLPIVELITRGQAVVDEAIDAMGRATIEAVLELSAREVAGAPHQGKRAANAKHAGITRHGRQRGIVKLSDRMLRVDRPRLRTREGEVAVPAYKALKEHSGAGAKMMDTLLRGVSTRNYQGVIREMADTAGVSKSAVSRAFVEQSEQALEELMSRRFDDRNIVAVYIDGLDLSGHHVLTALGVDDQGQKHILGMREGASENAAVVKGLLEDLVERGIKPGVRRLFIIDGSKALRAGIDAVYGSDQPVQRCRIHKIRNVQGHLPEPKARYATLVLRAAFKMEDHAKATGKIRDLARELEREWPSASGSLLEGLDEMFTVNRLGLPASLRRCLTTTNIIESPQSTVRRLTHKVDRWRDGSMALRWAAASFLEAEKTMRKIGGCQQVWMLAAALERSDQDRLAGERKAG